MKIGALNSRVYFATEHNEWTRDHPLLLSKPERDTSLSAGSLAVMGYSPSQHVYTFHILKTSGDTEDLQGTVEDRTWTLLSEEMRTERESAKTRITMREISPSSYILRVETFAASGEWSTVMEGTAKRVIVHSHQDVAFVTLSKGSQIVIRFCCWTESGKHRPLSRRKTRALRKTGVIFGTGQASRCTENRRLQYRQAPSASESKLQDSQ